jgi:hypothetical protein
MQAGCSVANHTSQLECGWLRLKRRLLDVEALHEMKRVFCMRSNPEMHCSSAHVGLICDGAHMWLTPSLTGNPHAQTIMRTSEVLIRNARVFKVHSLSCGCLCGWRCKGWLFVCAG